ncbi:MAG TPA: chemotaxis protein CheA [Stellaceae bacterium]|jgi:two-component system chemotaxis sensor kinase CheA
MDDLLREFIAETNEHLAVLERDLVALERASDDARLVDDIFRNIHSIKGTCSFLGLKRLESVLHAAESALDKLRDEAMPPASAVTGALLGACDRAKTIVAVLARDGHEPDGGDADVIARLELTMRPSAAVALAPALAMREPPAAEPAAASTIRVNLDTVERLMAQVSELVLARNQLVQMLRGQPDPEAALALQRLSQVTSDLQESVMKTRMQPIGQAWMKLPRMVRDLAHDLGKKIELTFQGGETELDRQVLELVKHPFTHLMRNAADHGIETPVQRRRDGKAETGQVSLSARQEGSAIVITLADDGRGIDPERIRAAIRRGGFANDADLLAMSEHQLLQFIFHPGFTTAARVTNVSGRGVGLDVVRSNVEKIGGTVEVASSVGRGTRFTIKIPLTLAIVPALLLDCRGQRFAIPRTAVAELLRSGPEHRIDWIHGAPVLRLRGSLLPLVALSDVLHLGESLSAGEERLIVIIGYGAQRFGIMVDGVDDAEEIVVKSLAPILRGTRLFAGCAILGDGSVALILDPGALAAAVGTMESAEPARAPTPLLELGSGVRGDGLLLFGAGGETPKALRLASLLRIEEIAPEQIEQIDSKPIMLYRGAALPLHLLGAMPAGERRLVMIAAHEGRMCGFLADAVIDTVDHATMLDPSTTRPGVLGTATVAGRQVEIVDAAHYIRAASARLLAPARGAA